MKKRKRGRKHKSRRERKRKQQRLEDSGSQSTTPKTNGKQLMQAPPQGRSANSTSAAHKRTRLRRERRQKRQRFEDSRSQSMTPMTVRKPPVQKPPTGPANSTTTSQSKIRLRCRQGRASRSRVRRALAKPMILERVLPKLTSTASEVEKINQERWVLGKRWTRVVASGTGEILIEHHPYFLESKTTTRVWQSSNRLLSHRRKPTRGCNLGVWADMMPQKQPTRDTRALGSKVPEWVSSNQGVLQATASRLLAIWPQAHQMLARGELGEQQQLFPLWHLVMVYVNQPHQLHRDIRDPINSLAMVVYSGQFTGGELAFPTLHILAQAQPGGLVGFRGRILPHCVLPWTGDRCAVICTAHQNTCS